MKQYKCPECKRVVNPAKLHNVRLIRESELRGSCYYCGAELLAPDTTTQWPSIAAIFVVVAVLQFLGVPNGIASAIDISWVTSFVVAVVILLLVAGVEHLYQRAHAQYLALAANPSLKADVPDGPRL